MIIPRQIALKCSKSDGFYTLFAESHDYQLGDQGINSLYLSVDKGQWCFMDCC